MRWKRGLSLIEVLVVIAILGVLMFMATSVGRSAVQRSSFSGAVNGFIADFNFAKQLASRENRYVLVDFAENGRAYRIRRQISIGDMSQWETVRPARKDSWIEPLEGREFFDGNAAQDFLVNSLGQVFPYPLATPLPVTLHLQFFIRQRDGGVKDYNKRVSLYPSGGYKVE